MSKPVYVLGTGLSHDGSSCLLKDGRICAAIEKERITKIKHDGSNDTLTIEYCLEKEGISINDIDLIVQNSATGEYEGPRLFENGCPAQVLTISHHLAHAYSAYGTSPFDDCAVLIIDGCGNALDQCTDLTPDALLSNSPIRPENFRITAEHNSYYSFKDDHATLICKEVSGYNQREKDFSMNNKDSIGDFYSTMSHYCFGSVFDAGKLMGLAPYGNPETYAGEAFHIRNGAIQLDHAVISKFDAPSDSHADFKRRFQYFADIASWAQRELERAIFHIIESRYKMFPSDNLAYAGGVALNAVINSKILDRSQFKRLYVQPAAGDNGISLGCAYYGWLEVMKKPQVKHSATTCFGKVYSIPCVKESFADFHRKDPVRIKNGIDHFFKEINKHTRLDKLRRDNILLQFNIENAGVYQIGINKLGLKSRMGILGRPTSGISMSNIDFYELLLDPSHFQTLYESGKLKVTNSSEMNYLLDLVDFEFMSQYKSEIAAPHLQYIYYEGNDYIREAARLLSKGKIVGWFQDESEFGPRALGRRSILADPRNIGVRDFINAEIKFREDFRPLAPSVLREDVSVFFQKEMEGPYMLIVNKIKKEWKERIGDVVHLDETCRIQTVTPDWNPKYYQLLKEFKNITGIPVLLNTSFNGIRMPIVETPEDAIKFFYSGKLDYLIIQDLIVDRQAPVTRPEPEHSLPGIN